MTRVMASGVFDILHPGHLRYLQEAREQGDELVVVVATDATVRRRKHEPITPERMRLELVSALKMVDHAYLGTDGDMFTVVEHIRPDIIALGYDQDFDERQIEEALRQRGLEVKVVRLSKHGEDLNGTRKIISKIIDWYTTNRSKVEGG
ncbi:MAG TPA: adenylyltransferase/cytidyltransferase family protein [Methanomassiliicoccales archaeon]|jgi:FAD synthetase|nr:adenylyltransferase/cytidyltransferase family protein [Methanomassiliicoccales archaeon]HOE52370.1 adenylyltransferase/cytidyltransferase family protein [Methanomassiliicoccales archaeon]HOO04544.1 adenylyltransferase/cytidyltransferase family protein [Methanomassiliicoccales archaeon]HRR67152.1 adenylyltransferase/cytidyltransferase family protein [Methanomassiliicoccales archaeon]